MDVIWPSEDKLLCNNDSLHFREVPSVVKLFISKLACFDIGQTRAT